MIPIYNPTNLIRIFVRFCNKIFFCWFRRKNISFNLSFFFHRFGENKKQNWNSERKIIHFEHNLKNISFNLTAETKKNVFFKGHAQKRFRCCFFILRTFMGLQFAPFRTFQTPQCNDNFSFPFRPPRIFHLFF